MCEHSDHRKTHEILNDPNRPRRMTIVFNAQFASCHANQKMNISWLHFDAGICSGTAAFESKSCIRTSVCLQAMYFHKFSLSFQDGLPNVPDA